MPARRGRPPGNTATPPEAIVAVSASRAAFRSVLGEGDHAAHPHTSACPTTTRSMPARSFAHLDAGEARPADQVRDGRRLPLPHLEADRLGARRGRDGELAQERIDRLEPGRARRQRAARLPVAKLGLELMPLPLRHVWQVRDERARTRPTRACRARCARGSSRLSRAAFSRAASSASGIEVRRDDRRVRQLVGDRERDRARAGADVQDARGLELERHLDQELRLGPRDQDPAVNAQLDPAKALAAGDVGDRLAAQATADELGEGAGGDGVERRPRARPRARRGWCPPRGPAAPRRRGGASRPPRRGARPSPPPGLLAQVLTRSRAPGRPRLPARRGAPASPQRQARP